MLLLAVAFLAITGTCAAVIPAVDDPDSWFNRLMDRTPLQIPQDGDV